MYVNIFFSKISEIFEFQVKKSEDLSILYLILTLQPFLLVFNLIDCFLVLIFTVVVHEFPDITSWILLLAVTVALKVR